MSTSFNRKVLNSLLPPGSLWSVKDGGSLDLMLDGWAEAFAEPQAFLAELANLRNPTLTSDLETLEDEYGISPDSALTEAVRRARLLATMTAGEGTGAADYLQEQLRDAEFDVYVHENNPAVDPGLFLGRVPEVIFGRAEAIFGTSAAVFGNVGGEIVANGELDESIAPEVPTASQYWPLVFFVGGAVTRNVDGEITLIERATIQSSRIDELRTLIVRYKPLHAWGGLVIEYEASAVTDYDFTSLLDTDILTNGSLLGDL